MIISEEGYINFFEINDGSYLQLEQVDQEGEITDVILMNQEVALSLAKQILITFGTYEELNDNIQS